MHELTIRNQVLFLKYTYNDNNHINSVAILEWVVELLRLFSQEWIIEYVDQTLCFAWSQPGAHGQVIFVRQDNVFQRSVILEQCHRIRFVYRLDIG